MVPQSQWSRFLEWLRALRHALCVHDIVAVFTMEEILNDKWERISGSGQCRKCGEFYSVSIAKDEEERCNEHYSYPV